MRSETLTSVQALEQRLDSEHRAKVLALDDQHARELRALATDAIVGAYRSILQERERCANIAGGISTSGRPAIIRRTILERITNEPPPIVRHPLVPDADNPTVPKDHPNRLSHETAPVPTPVA